MSIRNNIEAVMDAIQQGDRDLAIEVQEKAVGAIKAGEGSAEWIEYMETFSKNAAQLARLTPTDDTVDVFDMDVARTYLVGNGMCGAETTGNLIDGVGDKLDENLS